MPPRDITNILDTISLLNRSELQQVSEAVSARKSTLGTDVVREILPQLATTSVKVKVKWSNKTHRIGIIRNLNDIKRKNVVMFIDCPRAGWQLYRINKAAIVENLGPCNWIKEVGSVVPS